MCGLDFGWVLPPPKIQLKKNPHRCACCFGFSWFQMQSDWQPRLDIHKQEPFLWPSLAWPPHFPSLLLSQPHRQDGGVAVWPAEVSCWTERCLVVTWGNNRGDWEWERPGTHRGVSKGLMSGAWGWSRIPWGKSRTWHKRWLSPGVTGAGKPSTLRHDKCEVHIRRCQEDFSRWQRGQAQASWIGGQPRQRPANQSSSP